MPANATFAQNDIQASVRAMPLSVIDLINWGTTSDPVSYYLRESTFEIMADIAPENTDKKNLTFLLVLLSLMSEPLHTGFVHQNRCYQICHYWQIILKHVWLTVFVTNLNIML